MSALKPFQVFQYAFARHIRAPRACPRPAGVAARRMRAYNELLFNNLSSFLDACFPVVRELLGTTRWMRLTKRFFAEWRSHSPYFRDIPAEFLHWLGDTTSGADGLPPYLPDLAHYEWAELAVDVMDVSIPDEVNRNADLLESHPVVNPALMNLAYRWPVHRIGPRYRPRRPRTTHLLVYRKRDDAVSFMEINIVTARLIILLQESDATGREVLARIAVELAFADADGLLRHGAVLLENLRNEEVLLGASR